MLGVLLELPTETRRALSRLIAENGDTFVAAPRPATRSHEPVKGSGHHRGAQEKSMTEGKKLAHVPPPNGKPPEKDVDLASFRDRPYLGAHSLPILSDGSRKAVVVIRDGRGGEVVGVGGRKSSKPLLFFEGFAKPLILNATALKTLHMLFGSTMKSNLIGKKIGLYASTCRYADGTTGPCIRIHPARVDGMKPVGPELAAQLDKQQQDAGLAAQQQAAAAGDGPVYFDEPKVEIPATGDTF